MAQKSKAPETLANAGKALWDEVASKYQLRADELSVLSSACRAADMEAEFVKAWHEMGRPYMSKGSMGQEVEHPLIGSIDKQAKAKAAHLRQLRLPDDESSESGGALSAKNRDAANSRWSKRGA